MPDTVLNDGHRHLLPVQAVLVAVAAVLAVQHLQVLRVGGDRVTCDGFDTLEL